MRPLPIVGGAYESNSLPISAQESINVYVEASQQASNPLSLVGLHGTTLHVDLGEPVRGFWNAWGRFYAVAGSSTGRK